MTKKKTHDEVEHLRGLLRGAKSEIKHLKKKVSRGNKKVRGYEQLVDTSQDEESEEITEKAFAVIEDKAKCSECQGEVDTIDLVVRWLFICERGHRKTVAKK